MPESEARQIGDRTCAQTRLETENPKQQQRRSLTEISGVSCSSLAAAAFVGFLGCREGEAAVVCVLQIGAIGLISPPVPGPWLAAQASQRRAASQLERAAPHTGSKKQPLQPFHQDCWPPESQRKTDPGQLTFIAFLSCSFLRKHKKLRFSSKAGWNSGCVGHKRHKAGCA